jgi:hypothetical protein
MFSLGQAFCQSLTAADLLNITKLSHKQAIDFLIKDKYFTLLSSRSVYNSTISQLRRDSLGINEVVIKSQWVDHGKTIPAVHYELTPASKANIIINQLHGLDFKLRSKEDDSLKHVRLYDNGSFTLSIYTFKGQKIASSIEIHGK